jgi:hypothetical protein
MNSFDLSSFLASQLWSVPYLGACIVGIFFAVLLWRRHPMVSLLALGGFGILLGNVVIAVGLQYWTIAGEPDDVGVLFRTASALRSLTGAVAFALLIGAIFGWRAPPYRPEEYR